MKKTIIYSLFLVLPLMGQEPQTLTPAQQDAKKAAQERVDKVILPGTIKTTVVNTLTTPIAPVAIASNVVAGVLSFEIQKAIAKSTWSMNMTQKFAAHFIAKSLSKQEHSDFIVTNSKFNNMIILTFESSCINEEVANRLARQEPMEKYRKCGWDRIIFTNGKDAWAFDTSKELPKN